MRTRDAAGILHLLAPRQMAEEIVRLDAVIAGRAQNISMGRLPPGSVAPGRPRCETCRHWDRKYEIEPPGHRVCLAKKLDSDDSNGARVVLAQSQRYAVFLGTGPHFGCVQHEVQS